MTPPDTASVVYDIDNYEWQDANWMEKRTNEGIFDKPVSIYEVHLGSWSGSLTITGVRSRI